MTEQTTRQRIARNREFLKRVLQEERPSSEDLRIARGLVDVLLTVVDRASAFDGAHTAMLEHLSKTARSGVQNPDEFDRLANFQQERLRDIKRSLREFLNLPLTPERTIIVDDEPMRAGRKVRDD